MRIRVEASGVNFADIVGRVGFYPDLPPIPVVPGYEVSGRIDAAGADVDTSWMAAMSSDDPFRRLCGRDW